MAVSKINGKNINDYVFEQTTDPFDYPERLHKLVEHLRNGDEDYDDEADDLDDAANELEQLLDRIVGTIEDDIDYEK